MDGSHTWCWHVHMPHYLVTIVRVNRGPLTKRQRQRLLCISMDPPSEQPQLSERVHRQRPAPNGRAGGWQSLGLLPNNASGNVVTRSPCPRSKASQLGLCSGAQKPHPPLPPEPAHRMHMPRLTYNPHSPASSFLARQNHFPGPEVWLSNFLSSTLSLLLGWMYIQAILVSADGRTDR